VNSLAHQPPQLAHANGIDICYEIFGDAGAEPMLLIMGLGAQMIHWDDDFCRQPAAVFASSASTTATSASPASSPAANG
jgi:pimeloyl-ACP methyl ester carboxylesterase